MTIFWDITAHSVYRMIFFVLCLFVSQFDVEGGTVFMIEPVPDHGLLFTF